MHKPLDRHFSQIYGVGLSVRRNELSASWTACEFLNQRGPLIRGNRGAAKNLREYRLLNKLGSEQGRKGEIDFIVFEFCQIAS